MIRSIFIHDYAGYPFTLELAQYLAASGVRVVYCHLADLQSHKAGCMAESEIAGNLRIAALSLGVPFQKDSLLTRRRQDLLYATLVCDEIGKEKPDVVLSANTPLEVQQQLFEAARDRGARFYFWMQDFYSLAVQRLLPRRLPVLGHMIGWYYERLERRLLRTSEGNILITEDFLPTLRQWRIAEEKCSVIENWAPLTDVASEGDAEAWRQENGLSGRRILLYAGTLGMKHNPQLLVALAGGVAGIAGATVVVVSSGKAARWVEAEGERLGLDNLIVLPFQAVERFPAMLAAASVLLCILEPDAGLFSVPSKVLSYLCAARPILMAIPEENLACRIVRGSGAGLAAAPSDEPAFVAAATRLLEDADLSKRCGAAGRRYAEENFQIDVIAEKFRVAMALDPSASRLSK